MSRNREQVVNERTGVSFGFLATMAGLLIVALGLLGAPAWWVVSSLQEVRLELQQVRAEARQARRECVSREQFLSWAYYLQNQNHYLEVPPFAEKVGSMQDEARPGSRKP